MADRIILQGMTFYGFHGVHPEEKSLGQRFIVDLEMHVSLAAAGQTDDLHKTVHYGHVFKMVKEIVTGPGKNLIEAVAEDIAESILDKYALVQSIRVRVKKPEVAIEGHLEYAGVEIERRQKDA